MQLHAASVCTSVCPMNQYKPTSPLDQIEPHIRRLWKARLTDKEIIAEVRKHIDMSVYGISLTKFLEIRKQLGLLRTRQQGHTCESIQEVMVEMQNMYPDAGVREMIGLLFHEQGMAVSRSVMRDYCITYEPHLLKQCKVNRLQRRCFWAAGVNDIWAVDQHDKWLCFGLVLHTGIEPFSGCILWMKVWHSNHNPQLILSYYLGTIKEFGYIPMITQSDPGTENFGIANAQTLLRQMHDPMLEGYVQHRWMHTKKNIMPEIAWSQLRRRFSPGFESLLNTGVDAGWYDPDNMLQLMVFRWVFIPWLQVELNNYQDRINNSRKRRDKRKVTMEHWITRQVMVSPAAIEQVQQLYIVPNHAVFDLIPPSLNVYMEACYLQLGRPSVTRASVWTIYRAILDMMRQCENVPAILSTTEDHVSVDVEEFDLLPGLRNLHETEGYMGGVANGLGLQVNHVREMDALNDDEPDTRNEIDAAPALLVAQFSSEEDDDEADEADVNASL
ncbi:hypothetical protein BKA83DRAFT_4502818 [Pisolithus microcarpus]|nr:hypothetical protein BKA83DRAFT_4502815 [Pisolithus microcarpus]KAI6011255.1 hypothetical protein BKA83DRAFT_4502818 [Pisolithus microcarpus]